MQNNFFHLIKKIVYALIEIPLFWRKKSEPMLIMTLLVKNEEELLEKNLLFHKSMGVDAFIITDNNSSDHTIDIIKKYQEKGWILEVINEKSTNYNQKEWVDRMIWIAKTKYNANWIINADADELWFSPCGNIKKEIANTNGNVLNCDVKCVYPEENVPFWKWNRTVSCVEDKEKYNLSLYSIFGKQNKKVMHSTNGYLQISMGNHKVAMLPKKANKSTIRIYHYNIRGKEDFMKKMINGGRQLEQHNSRHGGRHWRYFYALYKENKLEEEYDRVIGNNCINELTKNGYIHDDSTIPDYFLNNFNNIK